MNVGVAFFPTENILMFGAGSGLWLNGHRGAATCNADTDGVFLHGVWIVQALPVQ